MRKVRLVVGVVHSLNLCESQEEQELFYQNTIKPVLRALYPRNKFMFTYYFSGPTLEWIQANHPEYLTAFSQMNQEKRIEVLGGGYFDPIFPLVPRNDRIGQIEHLTTHIRKNFGRRPRGAWISNYFWEPDLPTTFNTAGFEYTFLDDSFFARAGMEEEDWIIPALTEDQGKPLVVFPVSGHARRQLFQGEPAALVDWLISQGADHGERVITVMLDSSFNDNSDPSSGAIREQWLSEFFDEVLARKKEIEPCLPGRLVRQFTYFNRAYFEAPSLEDVHAIAVGGTLETPLPGDPQVLLPGINRLGYFAQKNVRHSLARYPEANLLYAKMIYVYSLVNQLKGDKYRKLTGFESLWRSQHHTPYWHGPNGGLYKNKARKDAYRALIDAEYNTRSRAIFAPGIVTMDFDFDGGAEYLFQSSLYNAYVHERGGLLFELDWLSSPWNFGDTCARHPEMYHLSAQEVLGYDLYLKRIFVDHFLEPSLSYESFFKADFEELGTFVHQKYQLIDRTNEVLTFVASGTITVDGEPASVKLQKSYHFEKNGFKVYYEIENTSEIELNTSFAPELNLGFESDSIEHLSAMVKRNKEKVPVQGGIAQDLDQIQELHFFDFRQKVHFQIGLGLGAKSWISPLTTHIKTAHGFKEEYQGTIIIFVFPLNLKAGETTKMSVWVQLHALSD